MKLTAVVVEDEWIARNYLVELLTQTHRVKVVAAVASLDDALRSFDEFTVDVGFFDVRLLDDPSNVDGLNLARHLRGAHNPRRIVLATASPEYAIDAFELGAVDYVLKPFSEDRIDACAERLIQRLPPRAPNGPARVVARRGKALVFLALEEIYGFEASERLTYAHHPDGVFEVDLSLRRVEEIVGHALLRVHRNWVINPHRVQSMYREGTEVYLAFSPELLVPVSRSKARTVRERLFEGTIGWLPHRS